MEAQKSCNERVEAQLLDACKRMLSLVNNTLWTQNERMAAIYAARAAIAQADGACAGDSPPIEIHTVR